MVVGYAAFQTQLKVSGTSKVTSNWDIEITNVTQGTPTGSAENTVAPSWAKLWASMEADLYDKGDAMEYDVTIENKGTLDAKLNDIITNLENSNNDAVIITFSGYTKGEVLKSKATKIIHVKIEYNPEYEGGETSSEVEINFDYTQESSDSEAPKTYLLTYDYKTNGGERVDSEGEYLTSNSNVNLSNQAYKSGWIFVGWNTDKNAEIGLKEYQMPTENTTLYAIYSKTIKVTYKKGENIDSIGKVEDACTFYNNEKSCEVTLPEINVPTDYLVNGWYNGDKKVGNPNDKYSISNDTILTSKAIRNTYSVTYDYATNGGTDASKTSSSVNVGTNIDLSVTATKEGWTFVGWNTNKDATTGLSSLKMENSNVTLYAIYRKEAKTITVTFNKNGASTIETDSLNCTIPAVYNNAVQADSCDITSPAITPESEFDVIGWNTNASDTTSVWEQNTAKSVSSNDTYYAITRSSSELTATFNANGATSIGSTLGSCYRYNGADSCNITTPSITRSGFTITGWGASANATTADIKENTKISINSNKTYYAITSKKVTITYNKGSNVSSIGNTSGTCTIQNSATNCQVTLPSITVNSGYTVVGWGTSNGASTGTSAGSKLTVSDNATYYANAVDKTGPTCSLSVTSATVDKVTVGATCTDVSGVSKYEYSIKSGNYANNGTNKSYTFTSFDLSTIKLRATDGAGNTSVISMTTQQLEDGYTKIYNVLNTEYSSLKTKKETYEKNFLNKTYPVGSIYISTSSTNPSSTLGGTWQAYAQGRTIIGVGSNGTTTYSNGGTGGSDTVTLALANLPSHNHTVTPSGTVSSKFTGKSATTSSAGSHNHKKDLVTSSAAGEGKLNNHPAADSAGVTKTAGFQNRLLVNKQTTTTSQEGSHTHYYTASGTVSSKFTGSSTTTSSSGSGSSFNIMNPYIVTYIWKRTA